MKKKLWFSILSIVITVSVIYFFLKFNPPLEIGTLASSENDKSVVIGIGNNGFHEIKIIDVYVNNSEEPLEKKCRSAMLYKALS